MNSLSTARFLLCVLAAAASSGLGNQRRVSAADGPPNVVVIITDDQGYGDLGFFGNRVLRTPALDRLAAASARLSSFYVSPVCAPTRASLMTGRYNYRTRAIDTYRGRALMDPTETTIAQRLRAAGYATGLFGKWHLGDTWPLRPHDRGFEMALAHRGGGIGQPSDPPGGEGAYTNPILFRNGTPERASGYCTDVFFREGIAWAERESQAGRPFFLYLAPNAPHGPYHDVPADLLEHYRSESIAPERFPRPIGHPSTGRFDAETLARTYAMIENIDQNVGRLTDWLARTGLDRSTLVLFLTDNGEATVGYNAGFRGRKTEVLEGGIRSMLLAHWPGRLEPGVASNLPVAHIDLAPTLLEACGVAPSVGVAADRVAEARFDGRSVWPLLTRQPVEWPDRTLFVQSHRGDQPDPRHHFAARSTRWKLVRNSGFGAPSAPADAPYELFDMQADPFETVNLAEREPAVVSNLLAQYDAWFAEVSQTRPDNWSPPRLVVGSPHENPVVLTRQDWRGADWRAGDQGHWLIDVKEGGRYTVTVRGAKGEGDRVLAWSVGDRTESRPLPAGETAVTWRDVELPPGPARLEAWIQEVDRKKGVLFVELTRQ